MDKIIKLAKYEEKRQKETLMLIPSENYTYPEVRKVVGSYLMHKYAEGQPGKRYYQGNFIFDEIEKLCEERALRAFKLDSHKWFANVQPHSGSPANLAVYSALLNPGDTIMSMYLPDGGHLSHGWEMPDRKISFASKIYKIKFYKVDPNTRVLDYENIKKQAKKIKPDLIISGGTAYPREIKYKIMAEIAQEVGAFYLADIAHEAGLIIGGVNKLPFPYADIVTMTTHKTLRGPRGAIIIGKKEFEDMVDFAVFPGLQGGPHMHSIAGIAIALEKTKLSEFKKYTKQTIVNAKALAKHLKKFGFDVVSGGTDKHLILIDLRNMGTNGWVVGNALEASGIVVNKNTVPLEDASPFYPSGIRLGTQAVTVRGMKEKEMRLIANWIWNITGYVKDHKIPLKSEERKKFIKRYKLLIVNDKFLKSIAGNVGNLCRRYPIK